MVRKYFIKRFTAVAVLIWLTWVTGNAQSASIDSLDFKIGQMLLIGLPSAKVDNQVLEEVRQGKVGSIILFEKNIPAKNSFIALKKIVWTYQQAAPTLLFVAIDQEGGMVNRLKDKYGFPKSITAAAMGEGGTDSVRFYAEATAATLKGLGINVNFAPVVDLSSNPKNPIIAKYGRAFSDDETRVVLLAKAWIEAHREVGVISVLKHFPGHGSSQSDTHLGLADVTDTWEERELTPYVELIRTGYADAIMSAHIVNRKLDPEGHPGTLSPAMLDGILRKRLHYNGVIFSDDMQMHAITEHYGLEEAIRRAINAGIDIMTFSNNIQGSEERTVDRVHSIIKGLVANGQISAARIDESYQRIKSLKEKLTPLSDLIACEAKVMQKDDELNISRQALQDALKENQVLKEKLKAEQTAKEASAAEDKTKKDKKKKKKKKQK